MNKLMVLGIDPGLALTGFAVAEVNVITRAIAKVREVGVLKTEKNHHRTVRKTSDDLARAQLQANRLRELIEKHRIDVIACEMATTTPYTLPTFSFGVMIGIVAALAKPVIEVLPGEVKIAAAGSRNATKQDIIRWAVQMTGRQKLDWPTSTRRNQLSLLYRGASITLAAEHPADALAAIQAALATEQFRLAVAMRRC